jgi:hypothetical protein
MKSSCDVSTKHALVGAAVSEKSCVVVPPSVTVSVPAVPTL